MSPWQLLRAHQSSRAALGYHLQHGAAGTVHYSTSPAPPAGLCGINQNLSPSTDKETMKQLNMRLASFLQQVELLEATNQRLEEEIQEELRRKCPENVKEVDGLMKSASLLQDQIRDCLSVRGQLNLQLLAAELAIVDLNTRSEHERQQRSRVEAEISDLRYLLEVLNVHKLPELQEVLREQMQELQEMQERHLQDEQFLRNQVSGGVAVAMKLAQSPELIQQLDMLRQITAESCTEVCSVQEPILQAPGVTFDLAESPQVAELHHLMWTSTHLTEELNCLQKETAMLESSGRQQAENTMMELAVLQDTADRLCLDLDSTLQAAAQQTRDYDILFDIKSRLEAEIQDYMRLLDSPNHQSASALHFNSKLAVPCFTIKHGNATVNTLEGVCRGNRRSNMVQMFSSPAGDNARPKKTAIISSNSSNQNYSFQAALSRTGWESSCHKNLNKVQNPSAGQVQATESDKQAQVRVSGPQSSFSSIVSDTKPLETFDPLSKQQKATFTKVEAREIVSHKGPNLMQRQDLETQESPIDTVKPLAEDLKKETQTVQTLVSGSTGSFPHASNFSLSQDVSQESETRQEVISDERKTFLAPVMPAENSVELNQLDDKDTGTQGSNVEVSGETGDALCSNQSPAVTDSIESEPNMADSAQESSDHSKSQTKKEESSKNRIEVLDESKEVKLAQPEADTETAAHVALTTSAVVTDLGLTSSIPETPQNKDIKVVVRSEIVQTSDKSLTNSDESLSETVKKILTEENNETVKTILAEDIEIVKKTPADCNEKVRMVLAEDNEIVKKIPAEDNETIKTIPVEQDYEAVRMIPPGNHNETVKKMSEEDNESIEKFTTEYNETVKTILTGDKETGKANLTEEYEAIKRIHGEDNETVKIIPAVEDNPAVKMIPAENRDETITKILLEGHENVEKIPAQDNDAVKKIAAEDSKTVTTTPIEEENKTAKIILAENHDENVKKVPEEDYENVEKIPAKGNENVKMTLTEDNDIVKNVPADDETAKTILAKNNDTVQKIVAEDNQTVKMIPAENHDETVRKIPEEHNDNFEKIPAESIETVQKINAEENENVQKINAEDNDVVQKIPVDDNETVKKIQKITEEDNDNVKKISAEDIETVREIPVEDSETFKKVSTDDTEIVKTIQVENNKTPKKICAEVNDSVNKSPLEDSETVKAIPAEEDHETVDLSEQNTLIHLKESKISSATPYSEVNLSPEESISLTETHFSPAGAHTQIDNKDGERQGQMEEETGNDLFVDQLEQSPAINKKELIEHENVTVDSDIKVKVEEEMLSSSRDCSTDSAVSNQELAEPSDQQELKGLASNSDAGVALTLSKEDNLSPKLPVESESQVEKSLSPIDGPTSLNDPTISPVEELQSPKDPEMLLCQNDPENSMTPGEFPQKDDDDDDDDDDDACLTEANTHVTPIEKYILSTKDEDKVVPGAENIRNSGGVDIFKPFEPTEVSPTVLMRPVSQQSSVKKGSGGTNIQSIIADKEKQLGFEGLYRRPVRTAGGSLEEYKSKGDIANRASVPAGRISMSRAGEVTAGGTKKGNEDRVVYGSSVRQTNENQSGGSPLSTSQPNRGRFGSGEWIVYGGRVQSKTSLDGEGTLSSEGMHESISKLGTSAPESGRLGRRISGGSEDWIVYGGKVGSKGNESSTQAQTTEHLRTLSPPETGRFERRSSGGSDEWLVYGGRIGRKSSQTLTQTQSTENVRTLSPPETGRFERRSSGGSDEWLVYGGRVGCKSSQALTQTQSAEHLRPLSPPESGKFGRRSTSGADEWLAYGERVRPNSYEGLSQTQSVEHLRPLSPPETGRLARRSRSDWIVYGGTGGHGANSDNLGRSEGIDHLTDAMQLSLSPPGSARLGCGSGEWRVYGGSGRLSGPPSSEQRVISPPSSYTGRDLRVGSTGSRLSSSGVMKRSSSLGSGGRLNSQVGNQRISGSVDTKPSYSSAGSQRSSSAGVGHPSGTSQRTQSPAGRSFNTGPRVPGGWLHSAAAAAHRTSSTSSGSKGSTGGNSNDRISGAAGGQISGSSGSGRVSTGGRVITSSDRPIRSTGSGSGSHKERISVCKMAALLMSAAGRERNKDKQKKKQQQQQATVASPLVQRWLTTGVGVTSDDTENPDDIINL